VGKVDWDALKAGLRADHFDNGRTAAELTESFRRCHARVFARTDDEHIVGTARVLADGVCNAYLVDVWMDTPFRRHGIGSEMVKRLLATVPEHHVALVTQDHKQFYRSLGFEAKIVGMSCVIRPWLGRQ
jgi:GNAT superfamily N-acetyltransferase